MTSDFIYLNTYEPMVIFELMQYIIAENMSRIRYDGDMLIKKIG